LAAVTNVTKTHTEGGGMSGLKVDTIIKIRGREYGVMGVEIYKGGICDITAREVKQRKGQDQRTIHLQCKGVGG